MNIQDWSPLGWTGLISLQSRGLPRVSPTPQFSYNIFFNHFYWSTDLQRCANFCCTAKWFRRYRHTHSSQYSLPLRLLTGHWMQVCAVQQCSLPFIHSPCTVCICSPHTSTLLHLGNRRSVLHVWESIWQLNSFVSVYIPYKWCHVAFVFLEISMAISRSIHVDTSGVISSFYSQVVSTVETYPSFFTHSSVDGHLDCFCVLTIAAVNSRWLILCADLTRSWDAQTPNPIQTLRGCF